MQFEIDKITMVRYLTIHCSHTDLSVFQMFPVQGPEWAQPCNQNSFPCVFSSHLDTYEGINSQTTQKLNYMI